jgi:hypothetical protein
MAEPIPIACSLDADSYATRLDALREVGEIAFLRAQHVADGVGADLYFRGGKEIHRRLREIVQAEAKCCAFLDMKLDVEDGMLRLSISAPEDAAPVVHDLVHSFESGQEAQGLGAGS